MIFRYVISVFIDLLADALAMLLAPIAALFVTLKNDREELWTIWRWIYTHDAPIDSGHVDGYWETPTSKIGNWWSRVRWIWRNSAYQVAHWLGYDQRGVVINIIYDGKDTYKTGETSKTYWTAVNAKGQKAFLYELQTPYILGFTLEFQFGWKLYRNDPDQKCMLAFRILPFKRYKLKTA